MIFRKLRRYRLMTIVVSILVMTFCLILTFKYDKLLSSKNNLFSYVTASVFTLVAILLAYWLFKLLNMANQGF